MAKVWEILKKIGAWLRDNPWAIIVALAGVFGAYRIVKSKNNKISTLQDAVAVQATLKQMSADKAKAEVLKQQADAREGEVQELESKIEASKRRVLEIHEGKPVKEATDEEVAGLFGRSGL